GETLHARVEAAGLVPLVVEVLHSLVVEQAVHRLGVGFRIRLVHFAAEADAPARDGEGEPDIGHHHHDGDERDPDVELPDHDGAVEGKLQDRGKDVEDGEGQDGINAAGAAFDDARKPAG